MKYLLLALALVTSTLMAEEQASSDVVKETYDYCAESYSDSEMSDAEILECVNEELEALGYSSFATLDAVKDYME